MTISRICGTIFQMTALLKIPYSDKKRMTHGPHCLSEKMQLGPNETKEITFYLTWDFPNRKDWDDKEIIGNYYSTFYQDAWDVAEKTFPVLPDLESKTIDFVNLIVKSDYPAVMKEAALFNSSTLRSQTCVSK